MGGFFDDDGFSKWFLLIPVAIAAIFVILVVAIVFGIVRALFRWSRNNRAPLITTPASVLAKRGQVSGGSGDSAASTSYYVTFEIQGGERLEFHLLGKQFGVLVERDRGQLTYQGTRYKGFNRTPQDR